MNGSLGYTWDFGDGTTSSEVSPVHDYPEEGFYEVTLTAANECGEESLTLTVSTAAFPHALFSSDMEIGCAPLNVFFTNQSTGTNLSSWLWEFPGGTPSVSTLQNPVVLYDQPGVYDVKLTVANALGEHVTVEQGYIVVQESPKAGFDFFVNDMTVGFVNTSSGYTFVQWDFGDGTISNEISPVHTYAQSGAYQVMLTVGNNACGSALSQDVFINTTATGETARSAPWKVFPNPVADVVTFDLGETPPAVAVLKVFDGQGRCRLVKSVTAQTTEIDLRGMASGIYFLEFGSGHEAAKMRIVKF
jgi:PKD repeat protein